MAFRVVDEYGSPQDWGNLKDRIMVFWDAIGDKEVGGGYGGKEFLLHDRSKLEFVRDQLTDVQRAELDQIDKYWKANAKAFNEDFQLFHARPGKPFPNKQELEGWVEDEDGKVPSIPENHWWWWPIEAA